MRKVLTLFECESFGTVATEHGCRLINATERAFFQLTLGSSCAHVLQSKKATESVAREKTHIRGTRAVSQLVFLLHVGALASALPSSAPRKSDV